MLELIKRLYPICRSITGGGVRQTLDILESHIAIERHEIASGTPVFDWTIPDEWNLSRAWIKDSAGNVVVDTAVHNLHVVNYSEPQHATMSLEALSSHLHSLPATPDWIPYRTTYYKRDWGFCLTDRQRKSLRPGMYEVVIDATLAPGHLTWGECYLPGESDREVLLSTHVCHPSLANDNCSGMALLTFLAKHLRDRRRRLSYRLLFIPGTIGSIAWLARNEARVGRIDAGLVASCVGDRGNLTYKRSRRGNAPVDRAVERVLQASGRSHRIVDFVPYGYDERQYCSPGFNLPVGCLMRTPNGEYPEYHTSADDQSLVSAEHLADSLQTYAEVCVAIEEEISRDAGDGRSATLLQTRSHQADRATQTTGARDDSPRYVNTQPKCEPQLGKRGLYRATGGSNHPGATQMAMLWLLNFSDGDHSLSHIGEKSGIDPILLTHTADLLVEHGLLVRV